MWGWISSILLAEAYKNKHHWLQHCVLDVLNINLASRGGEEEDQDGVDGVGFCSQYVKDFRNMEATSASFSLTTHCCLLKPVSSGTFFNLHRRPSSRSAAASNVGTEASGFVPAAVLDGGAVDLWLGRGDREGPDWFSDLSERPSPHKLGTYV
jgi:hypothetical protein